MQAIQFYTGRVLSSTWACLLEMDGLLFNDTDSSAQCKWEVPDTAPSIVEPTGPPVREGVNDASKKPVTVSYLTEQTSHHPPISAFYIDCPEKGISARGFDQLSAKFTGTSVKVTPGTHNLGIFIALHRRGDEEYQLTHPAAQLGGLLRGLMPVQISGRNSRLTSTGRLP